jgi:hypothetical protein
LRTSVKPLIWCCKNLPWLPVYRKQDKNKISKRQESGIGVASVPLPIGLGLMAAIPGF